MIFINYPPYYSLCPANPDKSWIGGTIQITHFSALRFRNWSFIGAGDRARTGDVQLGKLNISLFFIIAF